MSYKIWLCRFTGGYTNIIFTYSSFVALQCAWKERVNSRWLNWILRATILGSHWNMHELRILRLLHRRVFWKCDFSCELFILPTCVPLLILHLISRRARCVDVHCPCTQRAAGRVVTGDCSAVTTAAPCVGPRSPVAMPRGSAACWASVCVCRDAAAGRHDADGCDVPERHGHAAALPIACLAAPVPATNISLLTDRPPADEPRPRAKVGARFVVIVIYVRLTGCVSELVAKYAVRGY